jgi:hypothetical protein
MGGQHHAPPLYPRGKTRYPLYRRLGGAHGRSGRVRKISPLPGFDPRTDWNIKLWFTTFRDRLCILSGDHTSKSRTRDRLSYLLLFCSSVLGANAATHKACSVQQYKQVKVVQFCLTETPAGWPDLAPNAIWPFTKLISAFTRLTFQDIEGIKKCDGSTEGYSERELHKVAKSSTIAGLRLQLLQRNAVKLSLTIRLKEGYEIKLFLELNSHSL